MIFRVVGLNAGGGCRVHVDQLNAFLEQEKYIKTVTFIPFFKQGDELSDANVTKYCYVNKWRLVKFLSSLFLKRKKIQVVHLHLKNAIVTYGFLCFLLRYPYVVTIHQYPFNSNSIFSHITDRLFIFILKRSEIVISI